jgi:hypothetical protein
MDAPVEPAHSDLADAPAHPRGQDGGAKKRQQMHNFPIWHAGRALEN